MLSGCIFCENYNSDWRDCDKRVELADKLERIGEPPDLINCFLKGQQKVKELIDGKKVVNCPCYKFDSQKQDQTRLLEA